MRPAAAPRRIGPGEALELAVLGVASHGPVELDGMAMLVRTLGGPGWSPTADVVLACCERLFASGALRCEAAGPITAPSVALTRDGRTRLRALLRMEPTPARESLGATVALLKVAFLHLLGAGDQWRELDRMVASMEEQLADLRGQTDDFPIRTGGVRLALGYELRSLETRIGWLAALRDSVAARLGTATCGSTPL
jgi:DNA-binding PadR family transcriptional regulator